MSRAIQDPALISQQSIATQPFLGAGPIEWLLICCAHDVGILTDMRGLIQPHHFEGRESELRLLYEAICYSHDNYGGVNYETLYDVASNMIQANPMVYMLTNQQLDNVFRKDQLGLLYSATNSQTEFDTTHKNYARAVLQRLANERTVLTPLRTLLNPNNHNGVPANLTEFLSAISTQTARLSTVNQLPVVDIMPFEGSPLAAPVTYQQTGVDFIDNQLGGQRVGDCNGLLGPTGGGKTTLALFMAIQNARQFWKEAVDANPLNPQPKVAVYVTYEEPPINLRSRAWAQAFQIERNRLDRLTAWNEFSQPNHLLPYEVNFQQNQVYKLSEIERYRAYSAMFRTCFIMLDMSGSAEFPNAGNGHIPELASSLMRLERPIGSVYTDYAGLVCSRHMQSRNIDEGALRGMLKNFGDQMRIEVAERFSCTAWVLQQIKGAMGDAPATKLLKHTDAAESRDFAVNMAIAACLGNPDDNTGLRFFNISKSRYKPVESLNPSILRIDDFAQMQDVSTYYTANAATRKFISIQEASQVGGTTTLERRPQAGPEGLNRPAVLTPSTAVAEE